MALSDYATGSGLFCLEEQIPMLGGMRRKGFITIFAGAAVAWLARLLFSEMSVEKAGDFFERLLGFGRGRVA